MTNVSDVVVVCCRQPGQEVVDEAFFQQLEEALDLQILVLIVGLAIPVSAGRATQCRCKQSRKFLKYIDDEFLTQLMEGPTRGGGLLISCLQTWKKGL